MKTDEKIRSLINPRLREIHSTIQGVLGMGDLAVYVGQPMQDAMTELADFVKESHQERIRVLTETVELVPKYVECVGLDRSEEATIGNPEHVKCCLRCHALKAVQP